MRRSQRGWMTALLQLLSSLTHADELRPLIDPLKLQQDITAEGLISNLVTLDSIAKANGGNRAFGLPGYAASVDYIWSQVSNIPRTRAWKQNLDSLFDQIISLELRVDDKEIPIFGLTYSPSTSPEGLTAEVIHGPPELSGCEDGSYENLDVMNKIVLIERWRCPTGNTLAGRIFPAARAGAAAVIIYNDTPANISGGTLSTPDKDHVPAGFINRSEGLKLKARLDAGEKFTAYFQQTQIVEQRTTQNVFVETEEGDPHNTIILGAHLDSVQAGAGINDDGSGSSLVLEVFRHSQKYTPKNRLRFAWWAAEENGLVGSRYYCSNLNSSEINGILAYLNFDMVSRGFYGVGTPAVNATAIPPPGSEVIAGLYRKYYEGRGIEVTAANLTNGSDYASFWRLLNKPFGYLHTGTGVAQDPCYHRACDTIDNVNAETLTENARAAAHIVGILSLNGTGLIPKVLVNETAVASIPTMNLAATFVDSKVLGAHSERHVGCSKEA